MTRGVPIAREIVVSPFSNNAIRDWPAGHFAALIGLLLDAIDPAMTIGVIGTASQRQRANGIVRAFDPERVTNDCGRSDWPAVERRLAAAACVIGNNSGVAHVAARCGVPTVCIFGGSHQRLEWRPQGFGVTLISRAIGCSPCLLDRREHCPYGLACLGDIAPADVAAIVVAALARAERRADASNRSAPMREAARPGSGVAATD